MTKYKFAPFGVIDQETGANIPEDPANRDWQEYQSWLAEGNEPEPYMSDADLLAEAKEKKMAELAEKLAVFRENGFEYPAGSGQYVQIREKDIVNITGAVVRASLANQIGGWPDDFKWTVLSNQMIPIRTPLDMLNMGSQAFSTVSNMLSAYRKKKNEIIGMMTIEEVDADDVNLGW
jgi:hypothetical protein